MTSDRAHLLRNLPRDFHPSAADFVNGDDPANHAPNVSVLRPRSSLERISDKEFLVYKRPEWSNEEEVRLLRARGSGPIMEIEPQWLTRIILGKNMSPDHQKQIQEWAEQRHPELVVVRAYFDELYQELRLK